MSHSSSGSIRSIRSIAAPPSPQSTALSSPPSLEPIDLPAPTTTSSSHLDDIFGSSPPAEPSQTAPSAGTSHSRGGGEEPSDLPSVRRQHVTAGYRDGVSVAKTEHVQRGFDKGFPVGAEMGVRVGIVLGVLEGVVRAIPPGPESDGARVNGLYETAKEELALQKVFGAVSAEAETEAVGAAAGEDTCGRLARAGEEVVAKWEERVKALLVQTS